MSSFAATLLALGGRRRDRAEQQRVADGADEHRLSAPRSRTRCTRSRSSSRTTRSRRARTRSRRRRHRRTALRGRIAISGDDVQYWACCGYGQQVGEGSAAACRLLVSWGCSGRSVSATATSTSSAQNATACPPTSTASVPRTDANTRYASSRESGGASLTDRCPPQRCRRRSGSRHARNGRPSPASASALAS